MLLEINWSKYIFTMMNGLVLEVGSGVAGEPGDKVADLAFGIRDDRMLLLLPRFYELLIMPMKTC